MWCYSLWNYEEQRRRLSLKIWTMKFSNCSASSFFIFVFDHISLSFEEKMRTGTLFFSVPGWKLWSFLLQVLQIDLVCCFCFPCLETWCLSSGLLSFEWTKLRWSWSYKRKCTGYYIICTGDSMFFLCKVMLYFPMVKDIFHIYFN